MSETGFRTSLEREYQLKFNALCKLIGQPLAESPDSRADGNWLFTLDSANGRCTIHEAELGEWWDILSMNIADFASACELAMLIAGKMSEEVTRCKERQRK